MNRLKDSLDLLETMLSMYVCDEDFSSLYPSIMRAINIARMTMRFAPISIDDNKDRTSIERYFANLINVRENAQELCTDYHGFPSYTMIFKLVNDMIVSEQTQTSNEGSLDDFCNFLR